MLVSDVNHAAADGAAPENVSELLQAHSLTGNDHAMSSPSGGAQLQQSTVVRLALCCPFGLVIVANIETA